MTARDQRGSGRRGQILRLLRDSDHDLGVADIAQQLDVHPNTVRFHLDTLITGGQVERTTAEQDTPGRPPQLYRAAPGMDPMGPRHYRVLAEALTAALASDPHPRRRAADAGRAWGRAHGSAVDHDHGAPRGARASVEELTRLLHELGFAPESARGRDRSQIGLRSCPFLELAVDHTDVVCPVHLGLMQGAMESWNSPVTVDRLEPFVDADLCMVHLSSAGASR